MFDRVEWKGFNNTSGMILPMALIFLVLASMIVVPGLLVVSGIIRINQDLENDTRGYYAAKAGIADVYWRIRPAGVAPSFPYTLASGPINGMTVVVSQVSKTVQGANTTYVVQSTAKLNNEETATIVASINVNAGTGYPFDYAIASTDGQITVDSNALAKSHPADGEADVFAHGNLSVNGSVHGKGYYTGTAAGCSNITQGCESATYVPFQVLDETWYLQQAQLGSAWPSAPAGWPYLSLPLATPYGATTREINNQTVYLGGTGNVSYINGNLLVKSGGKIILKGVVWVNGTIITNSNSEIRTDPSNPYTQYYLLAHGSAADGHNINIASNTRIYANNNLNLISDNGTVILNSNIGESSNPALLGIIYAPNGAVTFESNSWASVGSVLGKSVVMNSNSMINYNTALKENPPEGFEINVVTVTMTGYSGQ